MFLVDIASVLLLAPFFKEQGATQTSVLGYLVCNVP